ncbi:MAG: glutamine amidotransferase-related protein [Rhodospirillaceae bacterium]
MFDALFRDLTPRVRFTYYDVCHGELPDTPNACDGYLCTGSRYSVSENEDWIKLLKAFVQRLHEGEKPFVGICFGHQMLAEALGGQVLRSEDGWGVGVHRMQIARSEEWMLPALGLCRLQYMHADQVRRLPQDAVVLGFSDHCEVAMFRVGETMLGIEGHPEFTAAYSEALMQSRMEQIGAERVRYGLSSLSEPADNAIVARWILNFIARSR